MKILHTADWHIGKSLHKQPLQDQFALFFDWLLELIQTESVDVLLVSGDVFDLANPSAEDRRMYYRFLTQLSGTGFKIIITGGNHDSVGFLNAPKELLDTLNITVIGGATDRIEDELIEVHDKHGDLALVVAAVPYLRDWDLRSKATDEQYKNRTEAIRGGIKLHYKKLADICEKKYPDTPVIAMGHLTAVGADRSESERDIHVGNMAAVDTSYFPDTFDYVALGHIHKPQVLGSNPFIRYSGSPVPLSFSEKNDDKSIILLEMKNGKIQKPEVFAVPKHRELKKLTGNLETVKEKLSAYTSEYTLASFIELEIIEPEYSSAIIREVENLKFEYEQHEKGFHILLSKVEFQTGQTDTADLFNANEHIADLSPPEVFAKRLEAEELSEETHADLVDAFRELYELAQQAERA